MVKAAGGKSWHDHRPSKSDYSKGYSEWKWELCTSVNYYNKKGDSKRGRNWN